jgi:hypothetical protein
MSTQECATTLKEMRTQLHRFLQTTNDTESKLPTSTRQRANSDALVQSLEKSRFHLGLTLNVLGSEDPYRKMDNVWNTHEQLEMEDETDTASGQIEGGEIKVYMDMRQDLQEMIDKLKEAHWKMQSGLHEHWLYSHLENAVMQLSEAKCHLGILLKCITESNEHSSPA